MKKCPICGRILADNQFTSTIPYCKTCMRDYNWQYKYGLSPEQYLELYKAQGGKCKICGKELPDGKYLSVDHNQHTGEVRGLLCDACNRGLGYFHEDIEVMKNAIKYLEETK